MDTEPREGLYKGYSYSEILPGFPVLWDGDSYEEGWCISYDGVAMGVAVSIGPKQFIDELLGD